jgi:hypothetical protein
MSAETDAWAELQALKSRRDSRRRKLEERKKERQEILIGGTAPGGIPTIPTLLRISTTPRPEVPSAAAPPKTDNVEADTQSDLGPVPGKQQQLNRRYLIEIGNSNSYSCLGSRPIYI